MRNSKINEYSLPIRKVSEGVHHFDYVIDNAFMTQYEALSEIQGEVHAEVSLLKKDSKKKLTVFLKGELRVSCDRCLEPMILSLEAENSFYIREAEEGEEEKEDSVFIEPESQDLDLSQLFYEVLMTNMPQKKTHAKKNCNHEMIKKLQELQIKKESTIDPRWKELEKLIKKEK